MTSRFQRLIPFRSSRKQKGNDAGPAESSNQKTQSPPDPSPLGLTVVAEGANPIIE
jgi:hypothetical protein